MVAITYNTLRNSILALAVGASLAVAGLVYVDSAEARMSGPRTTQKAVICGFIQDAYDADTDDMNHTTDIDEWNAILTDRDFWEQEWKNHGCDTSYGGLAALAPTSGMQSAPITAGPVRHSR